MNNKGQINLMTLPVSILFVFLALVFFIALIPGFTEIIGMAENSQNLNCVGYVYNGDAGNPLSYNATIGTKSSIGCMAMSLYLPYLILAVLIGAVTAIFYGKALGGQQQEQAYYG